MRKLLKELKTAFIVFGIGAGCYPLLELIWRGYSHWTMALVGGLAFYFIFEFNRLLQNKNLWLKSLAGALSVTAIEFTAGIVINKIYMLSVWDYSALPLNAMGQICFYYSLLWFLICLPVNLLIDRVLGRAYAR